ncbi:unnamed protein product [Calicophoron daubneyi]|uniref:Fanconi-associated nuclease n=1 Tax=Calicophoron daubneyi TaxID=300641 RepID=A0AAV2T4V1_CALDB
MAELADILLKKSTSSPLGNFFRTNVDMEKLFKNEISRVIGKCWRLNRASMRYLAIVLWLTSLGSEPSSAGPSHARSVEAELKTELYNMSLVRRGEVIYPAYEIRRKSVIYRTPEEAQQYLDLFDLELKLDYFVTNKEFQSAMCLFDPIQSHLLNLVHCASYRRDDVPIFLRRFTLPYRAFRILLLGIDLFERKREYEKAVVLIRELLFQSAAMAGQISEVCPLDAIGPCRASRLLVRLLIDEGNHLKRPMAAVSSVCNFMGIQNGVQGVSARSCVRAGQRLSVQEQLNKVFESFNSAKSHLRPPENGDQIKPKRRRVSAAKAETTEQIDASVQFSCPLLVEELMQAPKVEISAPVNATSKEIGTSRPHYLWKELPSPKKKRSPVKCSPSSPKEVAEPETLLLNVEQWVLRHYTSHLGYEHGMHSESQVFQLLFVLLFYDLLFDTSLPDVFYSYRQSAPLDLFTDEFYRSRRQAIDERLKWIREASKGNQEEVPLSDSVDENITNCWHAHHGERCLWANWDLFDKPEDVSDLFWCLGPAVVHTVCRQLAVDYRSWHSGLPDLVVWSPSKRQAKIIEVKGPGDHLSTQQMMWLDVLVRAGADVEVCHVSGNWEMSLCHLTNR